MLRPTYRCHGCDAPLRILPPTLANRESVRCTVCGRDVDWEQYHEEKGNSWQAGRAYPNPFDVPASGVAPSPAGGAAQMSGRVRTEASAGWALTSSMLVVVGLGLLTL